MADFGNITTKLTLDTSEFDEAVRKVRRSFWTPIELMGLIVMTCVIIYVVVSIGGVFHPVTWTTHIGGHECAVMRTGFSRSISCSWGKK